MTAQNILDNIKSIALIDDTNLDTAILALINSAYHYLERLENWSWLQAEGALQTAANVRTYPFHGDGNKDVTPNSITDVRTDTSYGWMERYSRSLVMEIDPNDQYTGRPWAYYLEEGIDTGDSNAVMIGFFPIADGIYPMTIRYRRYLPDLVAADELRVPQPYQAIVQDRALGMLFLQDERPQEAQFYLSQANDGIQRAVLDDTRNRNRILQANSRATKGPFFPLRNVTSGYGIIVDE